MKIYKNLNHKLFNKDNGLAGVDIPSVLCDYEGEIWVSCFGNGIYKLTNEAISVYTKQHGLDENRVFAFCNKGNGFLFSTANGLNSFYNNVIENISLPNELSGTIITSLYYEENLLFVGTDSKGLFILNETSKNIYKLSKVINKIDSIDLKTIISSILREPKSNTIWFSLYGTGIVKLQNFHPTLLCKENGLLPTNDVTCAYLSDSKLWIGSIGNGAFTLNTSTIRFAS